MWLVEVLSAETEEVRSLDSSVTHAVVVGEYWAAIQETFTFNLAQGFLASQANVYRSDKFRVRKVI